MVVVVVVVCVFRGVGEKLWEFGSWHEKTGVGIFSAFGETRRNLSDIKAPQLHIPRCPLPAPLFLFLAIEIK